MDHLLGRLSDADRYVGAHPLFAKAFAFLRRPDLAALPLGDYVLDDRKDARGRPAVCAMIQEVALRPVPAAADGATPAEPVLKAEAHGDFIDIQVPISGAETYGLATFDPAAPGYALDEERDVVFRDVPCKLVTLTPEDFAVFFPPCGGHAPCLSVRGESMLRKVVVKIRAR